MAIMGTIWSL